MKSHHRRIAFLLPVFALLSCQETPVSSFQSQETTKLSQERVLVDESKQPTFFFLGSSVTYGATTNGKSFVELIDEDLRCDVVKEAVSGTNLANTKTSSYVARFQKAVDLKVEYEHFVIQLSTNDATNNMDYGTVGEETDPASFNTKTTAGAMEYLISYIRENFIADITFYTNPYYNNARYEQLIGVLDQIKAKWGIHVLDYYRYQDMERLDEATLKGYMSDAIHPNANGYRWVADIMEEHLRSCYEASHRGLTI